ncbi:TPA: zinc-ribbon domain-containing protein [Vibrio parahaemolyticus]|nr:zinc-ribbon domain-containing protein [Vibrio parahaemolyticus]HCG8454642.1 zinc-ribbon domain-containing protein [Vibrio parahaemolyticus]
MSTDSVAIQFPYSPETVSRRSDIRVQWQCEKVEYHVWEQTVDGRVTHPNCPYCTGQRVHIKDSYYTKLEEQGLLKYLDKSEHDKAKDIILGKRDLKLLHNCRNCGKPSMRYPRSIPQPILRTDQAVDLVRIECNLQFRLLLIRTRNYS